MQGERGQSKGQRKWQAKNLSKSKKEHKKAKEIKKNTSPYLKALYMYTKPTHKNKQKSNHYILEKKKNGKVVLMSWGGEHLDGTGLFGCPRILFIPWMALKRFGFLKLRHQTSASEDLDA